jgi:hypothetical protein
MKMLKSFSLLLGVCLLLSVVAWAQPEQSLKIYATDGLKLDSLTLGIDPAATNQIDAAFGEVELPPDGPVFDIRFVGKTGSDTLGTGVMVNIHKRVYPTQTDVYKIRFKSGEDAVPGNMVFSWQAGLGSLYGGFWVLMNGAGTEILCDMTTQTSYTYPDAATYTQDILLVKGDNIGFFTATVDSLIAAKDLKGKSALIKKAYLQSEADFAITQNVVASPVQAKGMYVEFSQSLLDYSFDVFDKVTPDAKFVKFQLTFTNPADTIPYNAVINIHAIGNKGKSLVIKKYYFYDGVNYKVILPLKSKALVLPPAIGPRLRLPMPNWWNVGTSMFLAKYPKSKTGIVAGDPTYVTGVSSKLVNYYRYIYHKDFKTMMAAIYNAKLSAKDAEGTYACFTKLGGKTFPLKSVGQGAKGPDGRDPSKLYAELLALKFNVDISSTGFMGATNTMLGKMHYKSITGDPTWADGIVVDTLIKHADTYLSSCVENGYTGAELLRVVQRINALYSAKFDTGSWDVGGLTLAAKPVPLVGGLYRTSFSETAPVAITGNYLETTPLVYKLDQNYPNPFNPTTTISFDLPKDAFVTLKVYNTLGQEVATLINQTEFPEGNNEVEFNASDFASGVYFYQLIVNDGEFRQVKKMMLLK